MPPKPNKIGAWVRPHRESYWAEWSRKRKEKKEVKKKGNAGAGPGGGHAFKPLVGGNGGGRALGRWSPPQGPPQNVPMASRQPPSTSRGVASDSGTGGTNPSTPRQDEQSSPMQSQPNRGAGPKDPNRGLGNPTRSPPLPRRPPRTRMSRTNGGPHNRRSEAKAHLERGGQTEAGDDIRGRRPGAIIHDSERGDGGVVGRGEGREGNGRNFGKENEGHEGEVPWAARAAEYNSATTGKI